MARTQRTLLVQQANNYLGAEFEVFGKVQGVYFRNHTKDNADRLGVVGWISNSDTGTIVGEIQGERDAIIEIMAWLQKEGSPASVIKKTVFRENWYLPALRYSSFEILQEPLLRAVKGERGGALKEVAQRELIDTITYFSQSPESPVLSKSLGKAASSQPAESAGPHAQVDEGMSEAVTNADDRLSSREVPQRKQSTPYIGRVPTTFLKPKPVDNSSS